MITAKKNPFLLKDNKYLFEDNDFSDAAFFDQK